MFGVVKNVDASEFLLIKVIVVMTEDRIQSDELIFHKYL